MEDSAAMPKTVMPKTVMPKTPPLTEHARGMERIYRRQAWAFDWTRLPVLLGRGRLRTAIPNGGRVIEVGCGTGSNLQRLRAAAGPAGEVIGIECAPAMCAHARRREGPGIRVLQADFPCDPLDLPPAQVVVFSYSLTMMPAWQAALERARECLVPGGRIVVLDFLDSAHGFVRRRMERYGVELGDARRQWLLDHGRVLRDDVLRGWGGLWRYYWICSSR